MVGARIGGGTPQTMSERQDVHDTLSRREWEVLRLIAAGALDKEIADRIGITFTTVRTHVRRIFWKIERRNRVAATVSSASCRCPVDACRPVPAQRRQTAASPLADR